MLAGGGPAPVTWHLTESYFKNKQDNATSFNEMLRIYVEMIESLDEIGLSIENKHVQLNKNKPKEMILKYLCKKSLKKDNSEEEPLAGDGTNKFCLISGETTNTVFLHPLSLPIRPFGIPLWAWAFYCRAIYENFGWNIFNNLATFFQKWGDFFFYDLPYNLSYPVNSKTKHFGSSIGWGGWYGKGDGGKFTANGWVNTWGLQGNKNWNKIIGDFVLCDIYGGVYFPDLNKEFCPGARGFIGRGYHLNEYCYYTGYASLVEVTVYPP